MGLDIFNRQNLIGNQDINTINNFDDYLESLLNPFNNIITTLILDLETLKINKPYQYTSNIVTNIQIKNSILLSKYNLINDVANITTEANSYIATLTTTKNTFTSILNYEAFTDTPLTRPTLQTVVSTNPNSAVNIAYINTKILPYSLPTPIPNTKLYVNRNGNGFIWV